MRVLVGLLALGMLVAPVEARTPIEATPRYYIVVGDVIEPDGSHGALSAEVRRMFVTRLRQRSDVTLEAPSWLPQDSAAQGPALREHAMRAYTASVKIEAIDSEVVPSAKDPTRGMLTLTVRVRMYGQSMPGRALKIGGEGEAESTVPIVLAEADMAKSRLIREVMGAALQEAMELTAEKIEIVAARERKEQR
jgi:hypothetical protein